MGYSKGQIVTYHGRQYRVIDIAVSVDIESLDGSEIILTISEELDAENSEEGELAFPELPSGLTSDK